MSKPDVILFVKRVVADYQAPFFLALDRLLKADGLELRVLAGSPRPREGLVDALDELPFGVRIPLRYLGRKAWWSPHAWPALRHARLLLLEQANAQLFNYPAFLARALFAGPPVALVGHGAHFNRARPAPVRDAVRNYWLRRADWFFAYTDVAARAARAAGFPADRTTVYNNTIDTESLMREADRFTPDILAAHRRVLFGSDQPRPTGVFCARLVPEKQIDFLLLALFALNALMPEFRMIVIGDGPEREAVREFCRRNPWCVWVGRQSGLDRVRFFKLAHVCLHPAYVGLAVLDAFAMGLPLATTDNGRHSPEIAYLTPGVNGLLTPDRPGAFAREVAALLHDPARLAAMSAAARAEAQRRTIPAMAASFAGGIRSCLARFPHDAPP